MRYKNPIAARPAEATPIRNTKAVVTSMSCEKYKPVKATVWISMDIMKTIFLPYMSAILGIIKAAVVQPANRLEPMRPTREGLTQARSS
jgi:hypothetical protein